MGNSHYLVLVFIALWALPASGACDCPTSGAAPYCTGSSVSWKSHFGARASVTFDQAYRCGQYANGDFWVEGQGAPRHVTVIATNPAVVPGPPLLNGHALDPATNENRFDSQWNKKGLTDQPEPLPWLIPTTPAPQTLIKAVSATKHDAARKHYPCGSDAQDSRSCLQYLVPLTIVDAAPEKSGELFRPGAGRHKGPDHRVSDVAGTFASMTLVPRVSNAWTLADTAARFGSFEYGNARGGDVANHWSYPRDNARPSVCSKSSYATCVGHTQAAALTSLFMNDFDRSIPRGSNSYVAAVGLLQAGIDALSYMDPVNPSGGLATSIESGATRANLGGHQSGKALLPYWAAWVLQDTAWMEALRRSKYFSEFNDTSFRADGMPIHGVTGEYSPCSGLREGDDPACQDGLKGFNRNTAANYCVPHGSAYDGACIPSNRARCSDGKPKWYTRRANYGSQRLNVIMATVWPLEMWGMQSLWNNDSYIALGRAAKFGREGILNRYCGPNNAWGKNGYRAAGYSGDFAEATLSAYADVPRRPDYKPPVPASSALPAVPGAK